MKTKQLLAALLLSGSMAVSAFAADTTVTLSDVHMCCGNCVKGVDTAMKAVPTAKAVASQQDKNVVITAPDKETAQKAVNALVMAGYFGKSSDASIKVDDATGAKDAKVQTMSVEGVHLCCPKCVTDAKAAVSKADGVTGNTIASKATSFNVSGDFKDSSVFEQLNKAGFAGRVGSGAPAAAPAAPAAK